MTVNTVTFQILNKHVTIIGLPTDRRGDILQELIRKACSRKIVFFLFSDVEFRFEKVKGHSGLAHGLVSQENWFRNRKEMVYLDEDYIDEIIKEGEAVIAHELAHIFQNREVLQVERLYRARARIFDDCINNRRQLEQAIDNKVIMKSSAIVQISILRAMVLSILELAWAEGTAIVMETQIDHDSGEYIFQQDMLQYRLDQAYNFAQLFHNEWNNLILTLQKMDLLKALELTRPVKGSLIGNFDITMRFIGKAMAEAILVCTNKTILDLLKMGPKEFILEHEKSIGTINLTPLISLTSGKGIIDIKKTMQPLAKLHNQLK